MWSPALTGGAFVSALAPAVFLPHHAQNLVTLHRWATMASLSELQARREKLVKAMDSGALSIRHGEKTITYRSFSEMEKALARLEDDILTAGGKPKRAKGRRVYTRRGL